MAQSGSAWWGKLKARRSVSARFRDLLLALAVSGLTSSGFYLLTDPTYYDTKTQLVDLTQSQESLAAAVTAVVHRSTHLPKTKRDTIVLLSRGEQARSFPILSRVVVVSQFRFRARVILFMSLGLLAFAWFL